jgi:hypothetical protein
MDGCKPVRKTYTMFITSNNNQYQTPVVSREFPFVYFLRITMLWSAFIMGSVKLKMDKGQEYDKSIYEFTARYAT